MLTSDRLRELLTYDPISGLFFWNEYRFRGANAGRESLLAGCIHPQGYRMIQVDGRHYPAHRLAFLWMNGAFPARFVDHANGNRSDNRWANLRECFHAENCLNRDNPGGASRFRGVRRLKGRRKWTAQAKRNGVQTHLGYHETEEEAARAYDDFVRRNFPSPFQKYNFPDGLAASGPTRRKPA